MSNDDGRKRQGRAKGRNSPLLIIKLWVHSIMDFIISERHMGRKYRVPLVKSYLTPKVSSLGHYHFLKIPDSVIGVALFSDFHSQMIFTSCLDHCVWSSNLKSTDATTPSSWTSFQYLPPPYEKQFNLVCILGVPKWLLLGGPNILFFSFRVVLMNFCCLIANI